MTFSRSTVIFSTLTNVADIGFSTSSSIEKLYNTRVSNMSFSALVTSTTVKKQSKKQKKNPKNKKTIPYKLMYCIRHLFDFVMFATSFNNFNILQPPCSVMSVLFIFISHLFFHPYGLVLKNQLCT